MIAFPFTAATPPAIRVPAAPVSTEATQAEATILFDVYEVWFGAGRTTPSRLLSFANMDKENAERCAADHRLLLADVDGVCVIVEPSEKDDFQL